MPLGTPIARFGDAVTGVSALTRLSSDELRLASREIDAGLRQTDLSVPGISCGGCIRKIEEALGKLPGVTRARVNLSTKRVAVDWRETEGPPPLGEALTGLGYDGFLYAAREDAKDPQRGRRIRALAVAGLAAMNIMWLSISVWSAAARESRQVFHCVPARFSSTPPACS